MQSITEQLFTYTCEESSFKKDVPTDPLNKAA